MIPYGRQDISQADIDAVVGVLQSDFLTQGPRIDAFEAAFAEAWDAPQKAALEQGEIDRLTDDIIEALKSVYDPEIPVDIYELGLIYKVDLSDDFDVRVEMTLTAPGCPVAGEMPGWVENAVGSVEGVSGVEVEMSFDPPWTPDRMSEEAQVAVGWY